GKRDAAGTANQQDGGDPVTRQRGGRDCVHCGLNGSLEERPHQVLELGPGHRRLLFEHGYRHRGGVGAGQHLLRGAYVLEQVAAVAPVGRGLRIIDAAPGLRVAVAVLPRDVLEEHRVDVSAAELLDAAYGEDPVTVRCGCDDARVERAT